MKVMITGGGGFVGGHLKTHLESFDHQVVSIDRTAEGSGCYACDITDAASMSACVRQHQPDAIVHLAGLAATHVADNELQHLADVNIKGTLNVCQAANQLENVALLFVSSGLVYGQTDQRRGFHEGDLLDPLSAYAESKVAAEYTVKTFAQRKGFDAYIVRPFNHIGPRQSPRFVVPDFGRRIKEAQDGGEIKVGDLSAERDFTDVRDIVRAYRLILEKRPDEKVFVLGSGTTVQIGQVLEHLLEISGKELKVTQNAALLRAKDPKVAFGDHSLAAKVLGWKPEITLNKSLRDAYEVM